MGATLGYLRPLWSIAAGPSSKPCTLCYAASLDARLLNPPWMQISVPLRSLEVRRAEAQTWTYFIAGSKR